jgi:3-methylcrotonyl-CoA carboxylase alpha subunit
MFASLLVANRGEIACRVMRSARHMGIRTIGVYSTADRDALHVRMADEAHCIGPPAARDSYLNIDRLIAAARASGADAVHPGYGFLSESAAFAEACAQAGLCFVGPPPEAMRIMGSKAGAKSLLEASGVPLTPGYHGAAQDDDVLVDAAQRIGYPVLIKASAGGGGKGMRRVDRPQDLAGELSACRREALAAFGNDDVIIEKYLVAPRHIEVQIFADTHGNVVHLFERDCSVQRRHQKVIEEAPAPGMTPQRRAAMGRAAILVARAVGYVGAGTVEFIVPRRADFAGNLAADAAEDAAAEDGAVHSGDGRAGDDVRGHGFYFMEMNTRLQVEHPVTEMITGLDLVEWQLRVAAGEALPCTQEQLALRGHAIEARIYAEDADHGFTPATGKLVVFETPEADGHIRLDAGIEAGDSITPHYDPMIAKLIAWDVDRDRARMRLAAALARTRIVGVVNNVAFLSRLLAAPSFARAMLDTGLIERDAAELAPANTPPPRDAWLLAALAQLAHEARGDAAAGRATSPWGRRDGWRANLECGRQLRLRWRGHGQGAVEDRIVHAQAAASAGPAIEKGAHSPGLSEWILGLERASLTCRVRYSGDDAGHGRLRAQLGERTVDASVVWHLGCWHIFQDARHELIGLVDADAHVSAGLTGPEAAATVLSPMPGRVVALIAAPGGTVEADAPLLIVEAMKMEHTVRAPRAGLLRAFLVGVGDQVAMAERLADFEPGSGGVGAPSPA